MKVVNLLRIIAEIVVREFKKDLEVMLKRVEKRSPERLSFELKVLANKLAYIILKQLGVILPTRGVSDGRPYCLAEELYTVVDNAIERALQNPQNVLEIEFECLPYYIEIERFVSKHSVKLVRTRPTLSKREGYRHKRIKEKNNEKEYIPYEFCTNIEKEADDRIHEEIRGFKRVVYYHPNIEKNKNFWIKIRRESDYTYYEQFCRQLYDLINARTIFRAAEEYTLLGIDEIPSAISGAYLYNVLPKIECSILIQSSLPEGLAIARVFMKPLDIKDGCLIAVGSPISTHVEHLEKCAQFKFDVNGLSDESIEKIKNNLNNYEVLALCYVQNGTANVIAAVVNPNLRKTPNTNEVLDPIVEDNNLSPATESEAKFADLIYIHPDVYAIMDKWNFDLIKEKGSFGFFDLLDGKNMGRDRISKVALIYTLLEIYKTVPENYPIEINDNKYVFMEGYFNRNNEKSEDSGKIELSFETTDGNSCSCILELDPSLVEYESRKLTRFKSLVFAKKVDNKWKTLVVLTNWNDKQMVAGNLKTRSGDVLVTTRIREIVAETFKHLSNPNFIKKFKEETNQLREIVKQKGLGALNSNKALEIADKVSEFRDGDECNCVCIAKFLITFLTLNQDLCKINKIRIIILNESDMSKIVNNESPHIFLLAEDEYILDPQFYNSEHLHELIETKARSNNLDECSVIINLPEV